MIVLFTRLVLLAAVGIALYAGYRYVDTEVLGNEGPEFGSRAKKLIRPRCQVCLGQGRVKCATCGGAATVEATTSSNCGQCNGTGTYSLHMKHSKVTCPFCNGRGKLTQSTRVTCAGCGGTGTALCATCSGSGRVAPPGSDSSTGGVVQTMRDWFDDLIK
jgi:hypothetical protein